jgi:hypothetical protein
MAVPIRVTTTNPGAVPVYEDTSNQGGLLVTLSESLAAMPVRVLTARTGGAVPIRYAGEGWTPPPDITPPTLSSATIDETGLILTLVFSEAVTGNDGFTVDPSGAAATLAYDSGDGTSTLVFDISREITEEETVTLDYTPGDVEDGSANALEAIADFAVPNNSEVVAVAFDVIVNFSDGTGALTATKLNAGTHGEDWGLWESNTINYSTIEDHAVTLAFPLVCGGDIYDGSEGKGLKFDFSGSPASSDEFTYAIDTAHTSVVFLMLAKYATVASGTPTSYNNDTISIAGSNYTIPQRAHVFNGSKIFNCHSEGDNGIAITDPEDWVIVCGRHDVAGDKGEFFIQRNDTLEVMGASQSEHSPPAGDLIYIKLQSYLRGAADQGTGDIKVKLLAFRDSDLTWPPYTITVPDPTSVTATQTDEDEVTLTWANTCQIFKLERNKNSAGWTTLQALYNNNGVDTYADTDLADADVAQYRVTTIIGAQQSSAVSSNTVTVDNTPFSDPTFTYATPLAGTDTNDPFAEFAVRQAVVCGTTGSCVKLAGGIRNYNFTMNVKCALYSNGGALLGQGSVTGATSASGQYLEITLDSPVAVVASTTYKLEFIGSSSAGWNWGYLSGQAADSSGQDFSTSFAAFPVDPLPASDALTRLYAFGMGVIPA